MSGKMIDFYKSVLKFAGLTTDEEGFIYTNVGSTKERAMLNGVPLVLPVFNQLRTNKPSERVVFHPLQENILKGESVVLAHFRKIVNIRINYTIGMIGRELLSLAVSADLHRKLTPEQSELLYKLRDVHDKAPDEFLSNMLSNIKENPTKLYANIYLHKSGQYEGKSYARMGVVSFPFYEELCKEEGGPLVSRLTKRESATFKLLMEFLLPGIEVLGSYNRGSNSDVAAWFSALMTACINIADRLNTLLDTFAPYIEDAERLKFDADWLDVFPDLSVLLPEINGTPMQAGNEGVSKLAETVTKALVAPPIARPPMVGEVQQPVAPVHQAVSAQAPVYNQAPQEPPRKQGLTLQSFLQPQQRQQPVYAQQVYQPPVQQQHVLPAEFQSPRLQYNNQRAPAMDRNPGWAQGQMGGQMGGMNQGGYNRGYGGGGVNNL